LNLHAARELDMPEINKDALDKAITALATFDWGTGIILQPKEAAVDSHVLAPIDDAVAASHGDAAARKALETRLAAVLGTGVSRAAKDYVCRKLTVTGTAESVPALAGLLADKDLSHMARYALERIPAPEAAQSLRDSLPKLSGALKIGVIGSLGARRDAASVAAISPSLADSDKAMVAAAACALGDIGTPEAAKALTESGKNAPADSKRAVADACLVAAERLLAAGKKADALVVYKSLMAEDQPKNVRLAATRGMLLAAGKKE
jgi:HEAT repeat protein